MLSRLTVSNLAVVEAAEADFTAGLNVLTGETGAGKSVLMGALDLVLGARADSSVVRDGAREARVEAEFSLEGGPLRDVCAILDEVGIEHDETSPLVIRRAIGSNGAGRVWVDDAPSTVATLRRLARVLVDIHGPRANQRLLEESFQRDTLDACGAVDRDGYAKAWARLAAVRAEIERLEGGGASVEEMDLLRYQVGELDEARLSADDEDLAVRHAAAAHAEEIVEEANSITEALGGDEGAAEILARLQPKFAAMARHMPEAGGWAAEADELTLRVQELSRSIADAVSRLDADPEAFAEMDARLGVVNRLKRKYLKGGEQSVAALMEAAEAKRRRLAELEGREGRLDELRAQEREFAADVAREGAGLTKRRRQAAERLAKAVTAELRDLGFLQAKFAVRLTPAEPDSHGCDRVSYMFEPNPGEAARELASIASSGEIARVMLALKGVMAVHDGADVMVFDEIDANVGGETGHIVGEKMRSVSRHHQVIAITHLPQSAAYASRHLVVSKEVSGGRTRTRVEEAAGEKRVDELARMLGGGGATDIVRRHAQELLDKAAKSDFTGKPAQARRRVNKQDRS